MRRIAAAWWPLARQKRGVWLETAVLVALVPLVGSFVNRHDPLFLRSPFPWALLVPLVAGLRYGFGPAFAAAAALVFLIVAAWKRSLPLAFPLETFPGQLAVGMILTGMLAGEFCDAWKRRLSALERAESHGRKRFDGFARAYQVLRLSHDALEARVSGQVASLREGLRAVGELAEPVEPRVGGGASGAKEAAASAEEDGRERAAALGRGILELFVSHAQIRLATVFLRDARAERRADDGGFLNASPDTRNDNGHASLLRPAAALGDLVPATDPLVVEAMRRKEGVGFESLATAARAGSDVVLAVPLVDVDGGLWGVLAVRDLPFSAYDAEHRQRVAVMAGHVADLLAFGRDVDGTSELSRRAFANDVRRAVHDQRAYGIAASVVRLQLSAKADDVFSRIVTRQGRTTDRVLRTPSRDGATTVTVLLPFTDEAGIARYLDRLEDQVRHRTGATLHESGVEVVSRSMLHEEATASVLAELAADLAVDVSTSRLSSGSVQTLR